MSIRTFISVPTLCLALSACGSSKETADEPAAPPPSPSETEATAVAIEDTPDSETPTATGAPAKAAPDFTLKDLDGKEHSLADLRGKVVVLEWFNPGCPFVKYAHGEGPLAELPARLMSDGVVWLAINSGAAGKQGHGADTNRKAAADWKMDYPVLIDEAGTVGKAYGAKTTPHMYIIDANGNLVYQGGLDNAPLGEEPEGGRIDYVTSAIEAVQAGKTPDPAETKPYGCSVKYGS